MGIVSAFKNAGTNTSASVSDKPAALDSVTQLLRLRLFLDQYDYDDIVIAFNSGASATYNPNEDSQYWPGINAPEGLSSFSADGVALSINYLPLPKQIPEVIKLDVESQQSWPFILKRTELDSLPKIYEVWLMDNYKKDSVDLRKDTSYAFNINKNDTASFGSNRFSVIVRQNPALAVHLLDFNAVKAATGAQITWTTENEENYTNFTVERSSDGGVTFDTLTAFTSAAKGDYNFSDIAPPVASDLYRLKITDLNGTISYSNAITLIYGNTINTITGNISIYPNPTNSIINLSINQTGDQTGNNTSANLFALQSTGLTSSPAASTPSSGVLYNIKIVSITGKIIKTTSSSQSTWQDNVSSLIPGTYIVLVENGKDNSLVGKSTFVKL